MNDDKFGQVRWFVLGVVAVRFRLVVRMTTIGQLKQLANRTQPNAEKPLIDNW